MWKNNEMKNPASNDRRESERRHFVTGHVHNAPNRQKQNELLEEAIFEAE
jgi:hypothetical protein